MNQNTRTLTPREHQVMLLIGEGISNKKIAERMMISEHTVKAHLTSIFVKLGLSGRLQLALVAWSWKKPHKKTDDSSSKGQAP